MQKKLIILLGVLLAVLCLMAQDGLRENGPDPIRKETAAAFMDTKATALLRDGTQWVLQVAERRSL